MFWTMVVMDGVLIRQLGRDMRYLEYAATIEKRPKRLGVLGETHIYTPEETAFAEQIVPTYNNIGAEGVGDFVGNVLALYKPFLWASHRHRRSYRNMTAKAIARERKKKNFLPRT